MIRLRYTNFATYVMARLQEASTWRGIVLIITGIGAGWVSPDRAEGIISGGVLAAGLIGALLPDIKKTPDYNVDDNPK